MQHLAWICTDGGCDGGTGLFFLFIMAGPFILLGGFLLVLFLVLREIGSKNPGRSKRGKVVLLALFLLPLLFVGNNLLNRHQASRRSARNLTDRGFSIYTSDKMDDYIDTEYIRYQSGSSVPFAALKLKTPHGKISVNQARRDDNLSRMVVLPDKCDYGAAVEYVRVWGKEYYPTETSLQCRIVVHENNRLLLEANTPAKQKGATPFIALIGDTVIVFRAYNTTSGEFTKDHRSAEEYVVDFVRHARPATEDELLWR